MKTTVRKIKLLPYGVKDYHPQEIEKLKFLTNILEEELRLWGYREIGLPTIEFKELFGEISNAFVFTDCESGKELILRYDFTPQLLRFVLSYYLPKAENISPLRIFYKGNIFRRDKELWEKPVVGWELIGACSIEADAEILTILKRIFDKLNITSYKVLIGHKKIYEYLLQSKIPEEIIRTKEYRREFQKYGKLYLKIYEFFSKEWEKLPLPEETLKELKILRELLKEYLLNKEGIFYFYPALEPHRDYYSGIFFRVVNEKGFCAGGGRYNALFEKFSKRICATGGGLDLLNLLNLLEISPKEKLKVFIIDTTQKRLGWKLAKLLREKGIIVERDIVKRAYFHSIKVAQSKGYNSIIVITDKNIELHYQDKIKTFANNDELLKFLLKET
jgi:histidyl-tRNA synthetase